jgi:hypothetical protein
VHGVRPGQIPTSARGSFCADLGAYQSKRGGVHVSHTTLKHRALRVTRITEAASDRCYIGLVQNGRSGSRGDIHHTGVPVLQTAEIRRSLWCMHFLEAQHVDCAAPGAIKEHHLALPILTPFVFAQLFRRVCTGSSPAARLDSSGDLMSSLFRNFRYVTSHVISV